MIASYGKFVFAVKKGKILTFDGLSLSQGFDVENQTVIGKKPSTLRKGPKLKEITLSMVLSVEYGVKNVRSEVEKWAKICEAGVPYYFVLGGKNLCSNKMLLLECPVKYQVISKDGACLKATIDLKFQEYVREGKVTKTGASGSSAALDSFINKLIKGLDGAKSEVPTTAPTYYNPLTGKTYDSSGKTVPKNKNSSIVSKKPVTIIMPGTDIKKMYELQQYVDGYNTQMKGGS